jgi:hypothetical protein
MRRSMSFAAIALIGVAACGGSDSSITGSNSNLKGPLTASIDGTAWSSVAPAVSYKNNILAIVGIDLGSGTTVEVGSAAVTGPGTYSLGFSNLNAGIGIIAQTGGKSWSSSNQGGTGSLVVTTLTANHVVATFSFDAPAQAGGATGTKHVTGGKVDATY